MSGPDARRSGSPGPAGRACAPDLVPADIPLEDQNARLRRIVSALMLRVERDIDESGNAFTLFQRAIALEAEVAARTQDLQSALAELNEVNSRLEAATLAAEEASRAKSRFLAAASHDLLQPLNAAKLFIGSLGDRSLGTEERRILERLASAFRSVEEILGSLLDISRLDSGAARADLGPFPLARVLGPIANEFQPFADATATRLGIVASSAVVESDPVYLRQIVQNLVSNAVRYAAGGRVLIGARRIGAGRLRIEVHDTGPGIAEEDIPQAFGEFQRLGPPAAPGGGQGVGLGLAIVERACRLLGHPLEVRSTPGLGTSFCVVVPLAPADPLVPAAESDETTIALVLSADAALRASLAGLIEGWGLAALTAETAREVAEQVEHLGMAPDVVLADDGIGPAELDAAVRAALRAAGDARPRIVRLMGPEASGPAAQLWPGAEVRALVKPVRPHQLRAVLG